MTNNEATQSSPADLYRRATAHALRVAEQVTPHQLADPTPCSDWNVQDLLDHLTNGTEYLSAAMEQRPPSLRQGCTALDFRSGVASVLERVVRPGAAEQMCTSPLGFEWPVAEALAGTFMDVLIHTFDLARATGQDERLDPELVEICIAMFLPGMPESGRQAGLIGPVVQVEPNATPQAVLLAEMGRVP